MRCHRVSVWLVILLFLSVSAYAQMPRDSVLVNTNLTDDARGIGVSSSGELSAMMWNEGGSTNQVFVSTSDGRGTSWSAPVRVDNDAFVKTTQKDGIFVSGTNIYVVWEAASALCFSRSTDSGASFSVPLVLSTGAGIVKDWRVAHSPDAGGDHIYVMSSTEVVDEDLFLTASHDSGATFSAAVEVPSVGSAGDVDAIDMACDGLTVHAVWDDNRSGRDTVYYQRSTDGGATFMVSDTELGDNVGVENSQEPVDVEVSGSTVAVFWNEEPTGVGNEVIEVNVSNDGGLTFNGSVTVGDYTIGLDDTDFGDIAIDPVTGNIIATWEDNRTGGDEAYSATSTDGGLTFGADIQLSTSGAEQPAIVVTSTMLGNTNIYWESTTPPRTSESTMSRDGGLTWNPAITVSDNAGFVDFPTAAYNDLYNNFVHGWAALDGPTLKLYAGGYRPQTLTPFGPFTGGQSVHFAASDFPPSETNYEFGVLISRNPGSFTLPLGDGRETGLQNDNFLQKSKNLIPGPLSGTLDAEGDGETPMLNFPNNVSIGTTLHCVGVSFLRQGGNITVGSVTDIAIAVVE